MGDATEAAWSSFRSAIEIIIEQQMDSLTMMFEKLAELTAENGRMKERIDHLEAQLGRNADDSLPTLLSQGQTAAKRPEEKSTKHENEDRKLSVALQKS